jgi:hypothetical protein
MVIFRHWIVDWVFNWVFKTCKLTYDIPYINALKMNKKALLLKIAPPLMP